MSSVFRPFLLFLGLVPLIAGAASDAPEVVLGERLFLETRFSRLFATKSGGDVNVTPAEGDPALEVAINAPGRPFPGAFAGETFSCRSCHVVGEYAKRGGNRVYADFARRSPVPDIGDGRTVALRNTPGMVELHPPSGDAPLHSDGEFTDLRALTIGTMSGRNFGWTPKEHEEALAHIVKVIREDNGEGFLSRRYGGPYAEVLAGLESIPRQYRLPRRLRVDVKTASDAELLDAVGRFVEIYVRSLKYAHDDETGENQGSPYDAFMHRNAMPFRPAPGESRADYSRRLLRLLDDLKYPVFVDDPELSLSTHATAVPFRFGAKEFEGLKVFLRSPGTARPGAKSGVGNCAACHTPPSFTDFSFHNTGASQEEYDAVHGRGAFMKVKIPPLAERAAEPDRWLPATPAHPGAKEPFASIPSKDRPERADLGLWNVFANPDMPAPQRALRGILADGRTGMTVAALSDESVARFKTPSLRNPGQSDPYLHNGSKDTLRTVVDFYRDMSARAKSGELRNADKELSRMSLSSEDAESLAAFLASLNEDYE